MTTDTQEVSAATALREVRVWDPLLRLFHWSLVAAFAIAYLTGDEDSAVHVWAGYGVAGLVGFRLVWGFVGPRHARFHDFVRRPREILAYTRGLLTGRPRRYLGHNPLGGVMVLALLASLSATAVTGYWLQQSEEARQAATALLIVPARADEGKEHASEHGAEQEWLEEAHEWFANFTLLLVFMHIGGVLVMSTVHRENLVRAMITGRKRV